MHKKLIILLAGVIIIIIGVYLSLNLQPEFDNNVNQDSQGDLVIPENQFKEVQLVFYNSDGSISWHLESSIINNYTGRKILELSPVEIDAVKTLLNIDEDNRGDSSSSSQLIYQLEGRDSIYDINTGEIEINGPIKMTKDDIIFSTAKLKWQDGRDFLLGTGGVRIESPYFSIMGEELEADLALNNIVVNGKAEKQAFFTWEKGSDSN